MSCGHLDFADDSPRQEFILCRRGEVPGLKWSKVDWENKQIYRIIIWKQWKVAKKRQWGLQKLGVDKDLARCTAYCGDRYYWVATKTCVVRAISKEVFAKVGLISCLDYYNERHALKLC